MNRSVISQSNAPAYDMERLFRAADDYERSTGIPCLVVSPMGETLHIADSGVGRHTVCDIAGNIFRSRIPEGSSEADACTNSHLYGTYQAERFGGRYVYFCPMGLTHWASPVLSNGQVVAALLGGPVHMIDPDDFLIEEIMSKNGIGNEFISTLRRQMEKVPVVPPQRVNSLGDMLYHVAKSLSEGSYGDIDARKDSGELQAEIWEHIRSMKDIGQPEGMESYPMEKERELMDLIEVGDRPGAQRVLNEILGHIFFASGGSFEILRARVLELVVLLSRAAIKGGADAQQIFGLNYGYLNRINSFRNVEELAYWLSGIMARFTDQVFNLSDVKHADVIYRAVDYIRKNYMNRITLEEAASHVYLSPAYFSRVFKEEMKDNFNVFVNKIRVEAAKKMLLNESIQLVDVSTLAGFEGQSYFSKVFKKMTGVTPGRYRESRGKVKPAAMRLDELARN
jgi:AraC-like DNA-binding protein/ligand-binding sensor protein